MSDPSLQQELTEVTSGASQQPTLPDDRAKKPRPTAEDDASARLPDATRGAHPTESASALGETVDGPSNTLAQQSRDRASDGDRITDTRVGRSFADYSLIRKIASGGMGVVYLARQESLRRTVALKTILTGDHASTEEIERFRREAEAAAQLDHPGIVPIFEVGEHAGEHFFSMGYVEAGSLADRIKHGPLLPRQAGELVKQVAEAVAYAHQQGVIHRDLKPSNILLDRHGHPKVSDFGLAKQVRGLSQLTLTGQVLGTPSYMAPEQAAGKTDEVGPAADIYSLGALLYCLVTGRPPFQAATPIETLRQVVEQEPVAPRQLNGAVSRDLETICLKCLQKEPSKRYDSALSLSEDLRRLLAEEPILARPVSSVERLVRWCRRNRAVAALAGGIALALLVGILATSYLSILWRHAAQIAAANAAQAGRAQELAEGRLYVAETTLAQHDWEKGEMSAVQRRLDSLRPHSAEARDLRGFEWHYLERLCHLDLRTLRGHTEPVRGVAFSPDGKYLASAGGQYGKPGTITIWDAATGDVIRSWPGHKLGTTCVAFSPDGMRLASAAGERYDDQPGEVKLWDPATGHPLLCLHGSTFPIWSVAFSPDGRRLAGASGGSSGGKPAGEVLVWDLESGARVLRLRGHKGVVRSVAFRPDGRWLASSDTSGTVKVCDTSNGNEVSSLGGHLGDISSVTFSPDSRLLAAASMDGSIRVWDATVFDAQPTPRQDPLYTFHSAGAVLCVSFASDNRRLAASYEDHLVRVWDTSTQAESLTLRGHSDAVFGVAFSPDGWRLASASGDRTVKIWDATTDRGTRALVPAGRTGVGVESIVFSPDGRWLASADQAPAVRIWDTRTASVARTLRAHAGRVNRVAFSADSRFLASAGMDETIRIWDPATGDLFRTLDGFKSPVWDVAFAPNRRWLACCCGRDAAGTVQVLDLTTGHRVPAVPGLSEPTAARRFTDVRFSPDGRWLAAGCDDATVRVWNVAEGWAALTLRGHTARVETLAFSPDSRLLASAGDDTTVKLWDLATRKEIVTFAGHTQRIRNVAFSPDGLRVASAGNDLVVKLWGVREAQEVFTIPVPWTEVSVAFHPDGLQLAISGGSSADQTLAIWDARALTPELSDQLEAQSRISFFLARRLSSQQVRAYLLSDPSIRPSVRKRALALAGAHQASAAPGPCPDR
jgi:WD40 repeat protein